LGNHSGSKCNTGFAFENMIVVRKPCNGFEDLIIWRFEDARSEEPLLKVKVPQKKRVL
jgi:hypothetical protein